MGIDLIASGHGIKKGESGHRMNRERADIYLIGESGNRI